MTDPRKETTADTEYLGYLKCYCEHVPYVLIFVLRFDLFPVVTLLHFGRFDILFAECIKVSAHRSVGTTWVIEFFLSMRMP